MRPEKMSDCLGAIDRSFLIDSQLDPNLSRRFHHLLILAVITAVSAPLLSVMYHLLEFHTAAWVVLGSGAVMALSPLTLHAGADIKLARNLFIGTFYLLKVWLALQLGGTAAPTVPWFVLCPWIGLLIGGLGLFALSTIIALLFWASSPRPIQVDQLTEQ
jgi:hypothetical protein